MKVKNFTKELIELISKGWGNDVILINGKPFKFNKIEYGADYINIIV